MQFVKVLFFVTLFAASEARVLAQQASEPPGRSATQSRLNELESRIKRLEAAQGKSDTQIERLNWDVQRLTSSILDKLGLNGNRSEGMTIILFAAFCALWAQNTNRNPWLWFFLGLIFNVIAVLVLLAKNANDRAKGSIT